MRSAHQFHGRRRGEPPIDPWLFNSDISFPKNDQKTPGTRYQRHFESRQESQGSILGAAALLGAWIEKGVITEARIGNRGLDYEQCH